MCYWTGLDDKGEDQQIKRRKSINVCFTTGKLIVAKINVGMMLLTCRKVSIQSLPSATLHRSRSAMVGNRIMQMVT